MRKIADKKLLRVIDANFNRAKEGLRVCEDVCRFFYNKRSLTKKYKDARHSLTSIIDKLNIVDVIQARDIAGDVGKKSSASEFKRTKVNDVFYANSQRVKESIRVLEEFVKLIDTGPAESLKKLRYDIYDFEREIVKLF